MGMWATPTLVMPRKPGFSTVAGTAVAPVLRLQRGAVAYPLPAGAWPRPEVLMVLLLVRVPWRAAYRLRALAAVSSVGAWAGARLRHKAVVMRCLPLGLRRCLQGAPRRFGGNRPALQAVLDRFMVHPKKHGC